MTYARSSRIALFATWLAAVCAAAPAEAQQGWSDPAVIAGSLGANEPRLAVDGGGTVTAVWEWVGPTGAGAAIAASRRTSAGWTTPELVAPVRNTTYYLRLAVDGTGNAVAAWLEQNLDGKWVLRVTRYSSSAHSWSPAVALWADASVTGPPDLAADAAGNVFLAWNGRALDGWPTVEVSRLDAGRQEWDMPTRIGAERAHAARLAVSPSGDAVVVWSLYGGGMRAVRYRTSEAAWSAVMTIAQEGPSSGLAITPVALDAAGTASAVWCVDAVSGCALHAARLAPDSDTWTAPALVAPPGTMGPYPALAADAAGNLTVVALAYPFGGVPPYAVSAVRYLAATEAWGTPVRIGSADGNLEMATDAAGHVFAAWQRLDRVDGVALVESVRLDAGDGQWSSLGAFFTPDVLACCPSLAVDAAGHAVLVWDVSAMGLSALQYAQWSPLPSPPSIAGVVPAAGAVSVVLVPPGWRIPGLAPTNYELSLDDGRTWTPRVPASTASPVTIDGLIDGVQHVMRLRAINAAGASAPSPALRITSGTGTDTPTGLVVTEVAGRQVTLAWHPPAAGVVPTGYVVEGGIAPGQVLATLATGSDTPGFTFIAPSGAFYIRVRAASGTLRSAPSNEVRLFVNAPEAPSPPAFLLGTVNGTDLLLSWTPTFGGGAPTGYVLNVSGGLSAQLPLPLGERFAFSGVPSGTYTLSVAARNASGISPPSNPVTLTFPGSCIDGPLPGTPTRFRVTKTGATLTVQWEPPVTGRAVSSYRLFVDGMVSAGGPWVFDIPTTSRTLAGEVPAGTYTLSVAGVNACFTGVSSPPVTVVVP